MSFEVSTMILDRSKQKQSLLEPALELPEEARLDSPEDEQPEESSQQNPIMSYMQYDPTSSDNEAKKQLNAPAKVLYSDRVMLQASPASPNKVIPRLRQSDSLGTWIKAFNRGSLSSEEEEAKTANFNQNSVVLLGDESQRRKPLLGNDPK